MRMVASPIDLPIVRFEELKGPETVGSTKAINSFVQNVVDPFGVWAFKVDFAPLQGRAAREFQIWRTSLLAGGNCTRLTFRDEFEPTYEELGINVGPSKVDAYVRFSNGQPFSNGMPWTLGKPNCDVSADAEKGGSVITLDLTRWNGVVPAWFGIQGHFAVYKVIGKSISGTTARLKVWPPIRHQITTTDKATLHPTVCVALADAQSATGHSEQMAYKNASLSFREITHSTVLSSVTEGF